MMKYFLSSDGKIFSYPDDYYCDLMNEMRPITEQDAVGIANPEPSEDEVNQEKLNSLSESHVERVREISSSHTTASILSPGSEQVFSEMLTQEMESYQREVESIVGSISRARAASKPSSAHCKICGSGCNDRVIFSTIYSVCSNQSCGFVFKK